MDNIRATAVKRILFGVQTVDDRIAFKKKMRQTIQNTNCDFENKWNFNLFEQRPVDGAFKWEAVDEEDVPIIYRNSIINGRVPPYMTARVTK